MTQGSIETVNYYTIKIGDAFIKEFKVGSVYGLADEKSVIRKISLSGYAGDAYRWYFDSLAEVGEEEDFLQEKDFVKTLKMLEDSGMTCKVSKTTTVTTEEQKEVSFVDGKEGKIDKSEAFDLYFHILNKCGIAPAIIGKLSEAELEGLATGGLVDGSGRSAVLHNDFVLNKGSAEKRVVTESYKEALIAINKEIRSLQDSQIKFPIYSKQYQDALKAEIELQKEKKSVLESQSVALEDEILAAKAKEHVEEICNSTKDAGLAIGSSLKSVLLRLEGDSDDTDFKTVLDRATESAERFGQSISKVMDSYVEFAKQGYKGDELSSVIRRICEDVIEAREKEKVEQFKSAIQGVSITTMKLR